MGLVHSKQELDQLHKHFAKGHFLGDATMVMAMFRTDPEVLRRFLPPPLEAPPTPTGTVYVAEFHETNFDAPYNEAALFLAAQYKGEIGSYCLAMPVTRDNPMWGGRETYGFPKKLADSIRVTRKGNTATGTCTRRGAPVITLTIQLTGPFPGTIPTTPNFLIKAFPSATGEGFDAPPLLIRERNDISWGTPEIGAGTLTLGPSKLDPLQDIPVHEVVMAGYTTGMRIWIKPGTVLTQVDPKQYYPYSFINKDWPL
jgi:acetoacetate decarboxylase